VTNNSSKTREQYAKKCEELGFSIALEQIIGTANVTAWYLKQQGFQGKRVYLVGGDAMSIELANVGIDTFGSGSDDILSGNYADWARTSLQLEENVAAVVVGFDQNFNFVKHTKAVSYIKGKKLPFIATNEDPNMPLGSGIVLAGTGSIVQAVSYAAEKPPDVIIGKPHSHMIDFLKASNGIDPATTIMIGDRMNTDMLFGSNNGIRTLMVLTGCSTLEEVEQRECSKNPNERKEIPNFYADSVGTLIDGLNLI